MVQHFSLAFSESPVQAASDSLSEAAPSFPESALNPVAIPPVATMDEACSMEVVEGTAGSVQIQVLRAPDGSKERSSPRLLPLAVLPWVGGFIGFSYVGSVQDQQLAHKLMPITDLHRANLRYDVVLIFF